MGTPLLLCPEAAGIAAEALSKPPIFCLEILTAKQLRSPHGQWFLAPHPTIALKKWQSDRIEALGSKVVKTPERCLQHSGTNPGLDLDQNPLKSGQSS